MASVSLPYPCEIAPGKLQVLVDLLNTFLPEVAIPNPEHLREIFVVANGRNEEFINTLLSLGNEKGTYVAGSHADAQAIPIENNATLACYIVLDERFVQKIDPQDPNASKIVVPLLEELFHVRHYSTLWQQQGQVLPKIDTVYPKDLIKMCFSFYDEYIVNRWKFAYLAQQLSGFTSSDFSLIATLDQAQPQLTDIIQQAASNTISTQDAWLRVLRCAYRNVFELLARNAAPIAAIPQEKREAPLDLNQSQFYRTKVADYWQHIEKELDSAYMSDLKTTREALYAIVQVMTDFFASIDITYRKTAQGNWRIDFIVK